MQSPRRADVAPTARIEEGTLLTVSAATNNKSSKSTKYEFYRWRSQLCIAKIFYQTSFEMHIVHGRKKTPSHTISYLVVCLWI